MRAPSPNPHNAVFDARDVRDMWELRAQFARTELTLAFAFLQTASVVSDPKRAQTSVRAAIAALRTVNRFLADDGDGEYADIWQGRDELRGRLRALMRANYRTRERRLPAVL